MEKILIDKLVENKWACQFDINTLEILISNEESRNLIQKFGDLCNSINYQFSNPGNSFERKLMAPVQLEINANQTMRGFQHMII